MPVVVKPSRYCYITRVTM